MTTTVPPAATSTMTDEAPPAALANGEVLSDRYRVVGALARGGMASVYRGWDERLGRAVAIKVLDRPAVAPWQEARLTAAVNHPHVVPVYDSGVLPDGRPFLVMELVEGETLDHLAPLPLPDALRLTRQVVAALGAAHAVGVVHCDLKPRNVLVDRYGQARLTDFGVATVTATPTGAFVYGSAPYLAPERLRGAPTTPSVDLYAAGALLYALLTGEPPYRAPDLPGLLARAEAGAPPPLTGRVAGATPALDRLLATALHPDPAERFPSTAALETALAELEEGRLDDATAGADWDARRGDTAVLRTHAEEELGAGKTSTTPMKQGRRWHRVRRSWLAPLLAGAAILVVLLGVGRVIGSARASQATPGSAATVAVPDLAGLSLGAAYHRLQDAGLKPGRVDIAPGPGTPPNVVVYQDPAPGATVPAGTTVNYVIRTAP